MIKATKTTETEAQISSLRNIHAGGRAFIIGNGPSLKIPDLSLLKNEITFASNKIYLAYEETDWRPTYYTVADELVAAYNRERILQIESNLLLMSTIKKHISSDNPGIFWIKELFDNTVLKKCEKPLLFPVNELFFSEDCEKGIQAGWTVIYNQLQMAFYMGIRTVYLIGVDFSFQVPSSIVDSTIYKKAVECRGEVNHFHKDYRKPGEKWSIPNLDYQHKMFEKAHHFYKDNNGSIYNASRQTKLDVFPRLDYDELFK